MRLLQRLDHSFVLREYSNDVPPYGILSHVWGNDEVDYQDIQNKTAHTKEGFKKLLFCSRQAQGDGLEHFWVDACCVDKTSSSELSEAINSMFRWYQNAAQCYVYLSDVSLKGSIGDGATLQASALVASRWFTRTWTLIELIAPAHVKFYDHQCQLIGDKESFQAAIQSKTGIPAKVLSQTKALSTYSVEQKLDWAKGRRATRPEDESYALLGLFDIQIPIIYGEGLDYARRRLRAAIRTAAEKAREKPTDAERPPPVKRYQKTPPTSLYTDTLPVGKIRILTIEQGIFHEPLEARIEEFDIEAAPAYNALSYTWGQEPAIHRIRVNTLVTKIRPNLWSALQRIRLRSGSIQLWVDSMCINQENERERSTQVRNMATIYRNASSVLIWLGEDDLNSQVAMEFVPKVIDRKFVWDDKWWQRFEFRALAGLLERSWFRRGWVVQEAASSSNSTIYCGTSQVHMDQFSTAVHLARARYGSAAMNYHKDMHAGIIRNFRDSAAIRLLDIVEDVFRRGRNGSLVRQMTLETLVVDIGTYMQTGDQRDTIYCFLNLANNAITSPGADESSDLQHIRPDYRKSLTQVYVDFVLHCCAGGSLDIICRPWAPVATLGHEMILNLSIEGTTVSTISHPSWVIGRESLPFGDPSAQEQGHRLNGVPLVGTSQKRRYRAHGNTTCQVAVADAEFGDGVLCIKGSILGRVTKLSTRMADSIITRDCLELLGTVVRNQNSGLPSFPDAMWRTLCADRDERGDRAPTSFRVAFTYMLLHALESSTTYLESNSSLDHVLSSPPQRPSTDEQASYSMTLNGWSRQKKSTRDAADSEEGANLLQHMSSIDVEEVLESQQAEHIRDFLLAARNVLCNRRTFQCQRLRTESITVPTADNSHARDKEPLDPHASTQPIDAEQHGQTQQSGEAEKTLDEHAGSQGPAAPEHEEEDEHVFVGLAPQRAKARDIICILHGCSVPVVLRLSRTAHKRSIWKLVGEAYVYGAMDGEIVGEGSHAEPTYSFYIE